MVFNCSNTCRLGFMMGLVIAYFFVELIFGYMINSLSLVADSFHMLSDFLALGVGIAATRIAKWPRSSKNTFGWQRAEVMGSMMNTTILITLCFTILMDAIQRFMQPEQVEHPNYMVYVGAGGLLINVLGLLVLGGHSHEHSPGEIEISEADDQPLPESRVSSVDYMDNLLNKDFQSRSTPNATKPTTEAHSINHDPTAQHVVQLTSTNSHSKQTDKKLAESKAKKMNPLNSLNMRAVFLHVLADFLGSVIVVVSALILWLVPGGNDANEVRWKLYVDPAMSVLMVIIILWTAIPLVYKSALILLQSVPKEICLKNLKVRMENIDGIHKIHDLHVWRLQSNCIIGTVHIRCVSLPDYINIARQVKQLFHEFGIHCTTIQPEFEEHAYEVAAATDYQTCVLDCYPDKKCQSDTCCPAPVISPPPVVTTFNGTTTQSQTNTNFAPANSTAALMTTSSRKTPFSVPTTGAQGGFTG